MVNTDANQPRRNLVLLRCGDESLHTSFFVGSSAPRNWDLHISYYGTAGAPPAVAGEPFTWTAEGLTKFDGIAACVAKAPFDLDAYDYVAVPDDDVICTRDGWNDAFDLARQHKLAACQFSLHPRSFFSLDFTLRRSGLRLRWVTMIELFAIIRVDIFKRLLPIFASPGNMWAIGHVLAEMQKDEPRSLAVLDAVCQLHTRAIGVGPLYERGRGIGKTPHQIWHDFMLQHGIPYHEPQVLGALDADGNEVQGLWLVNRPRILPRLRRKYRKWRNITSIVGGANELFY
jgi:hypothetical protein